jgi:hypothetical protein
MPSEPTVWQELATTVSADAFPPAATALFAGAVAHAFAAPWFARLARRRAATAPGIGASALHLLGEVEAIFGLWAFAFLVLALAWPGKGWGFLSTYLAGAAGPSKFLEPLFVFIVMAIAASRPILEAARRLLEAVSAWFGGGVAARWLVLLTLAPLLGSVITEPAAMTIAASLLAVQFYRLGPSVSLRYATLALLFVNISVGGALTHFAAPPVVMVAARWGWGTPEVFRQFGVAALVSVALANACCFVWFRRELLALRVADAAPANASTVPFWVTLVHVGLIAWTILMLSAHRALPMVAGFAAYVGFVAATRRWQDPWRLRNPAMVALFLAALVVLGGMQSWWIAPCIARLGEAGLLAASVVLTSFNDNAAVTYLAAQVPALAEPTAAALRHAVLAGALAGGGLTVIANAPNPAGQAILGEYFPEGVSPGRLFLWALPPTALAVATFLFLR